MDQKKSATRLQEMQQFPRMKKINRDPKNKSLVEPLGYENCLDTKSKRAGEGLEGRAQR